MFAMCTVVEMGRDGAGEWVGATCRLVAVDGIVVRNILVVEMIHLYVFI